MRSALLALVLLLPARRVDAEWQVRPFLGATFAGKTTFVDLDQGAGKPNVAIGVNGALLGNIVGVEVDFGYMPGFFQSGNRELVRDNSVTTLTGNAIIAAPRRRTEYTLGPYFVGGMGLVRAHVEDVLGVFTVSRTLPTVDLGGGVTGNLSQSIGLMWDARYFRSVGGKIRGLSVDPLNAKERISFWRASMAVVFRY
jgi:hypothetical protein